MTRFLSAAAVKAPSKLMRGAALGLALLGGGLSLAPDQAQAYHRERHWVQGSGHEPHYRPAPRHRHRHFAPVYSDYGYRPFVRHVPRAPVAGYYAPAFYGEHCVVKKKWRGFHRVRRVVCF